MARFRQLIVRFEDFILVPGKRLTHREIFNFSLEYHRIVAKALEKLPNDGQIV